MANKLVASSASLRSSLLACALLRCAARNSCSSTAKAVAVPKKPVAINQNATRRGRTSISSGLAPLRCVKIGRPSL